MKKLCCFPLALILCLVFFTQASAADTQTVKLDEVGMTISLPYDLVTFTRDTKDDDPNLAAYNLKNDDLQALFTERSIYLNAWNDSVDYEIVVTMSANPVDDFGAISDDTLTSLTTTLKSEYEKNGASYIKSALYKTEQTKFIKIYFSQPNNSKTEYGLQYYTVVGGKAINITLYSYTGEISSANESLMDAIADSAVFDGAAEAASSNIPPAAPFRYTDSETNASFVVPAGWTQESGSWEVLDAKFVPNDGSSQIIMYGCKDWWSELTPEEQAGSHRSDYNTTSLTKSDVGKMLNVPASDVSTVTYNGTEYYTGQTKTTDDTTNLEVQMTEVIRVNNGYIYIFQFAGARDSAHYADFEALLNSANYPNDLPAAGTAAANTAGTPSSRGVVYTVVDILLSLLLTVCVYSLPILIYRFGIRRSYVERKKAKIITVIYAVFAFAIMCVIIVALGGSVTGGGAIVFWSFINYSILTKGAPKHEADTGGSPGVYTGDEAERWSPRK